jgi:maltose O-acetyltransferase
MDEMELERRLVTGGQTGEGRVRHARAALRNRIGSTGFRVGIHLINMASNLLGDDIVGRSIRARILRMAGARLDRLATMHGGTYLSKPSNLTLGYHTLINRNCYLDLEAPISFADYSGAGHGATFITTVHNIVPGMNLGVGMEAKPIEVGERAWIGANATVLPGTVIGHDAIIAAGTLVSGKVPANSLMAGVPGKIVRREVRAWLHDLIGEVEETPRTNATADGAA